MKKSSLLTLGIASILFPMSLLLVSSTDKPEQKPAANKSVKAVLSSESKNTALRPKAPSRQVVTCAYDGEYLMFDFVVPEGECDVVVTEWFSNAQQSYTIDSSILTADIHVGELYESTVTVTTEKGNVYTADLTAE